MSAIAVEPSRGGVSAQQRAAARALLLPIYTPPLRAKENQDILWNAVRTDTLSAISTDYCAFLRDGQKTMGKDDFSKIPNGGPGLRCDDSVSPQATA
jgi:hypothetical protein